MVCDVLALDGSDGQLLVCHDRLGCHPCHPLHLLLPPVACRPTASQLVLGLVIALVLWCVFWVGDKVSQLLFSFARPQVDMIYGMKSGTASALIGVLLLLVIGPAEEIFWRGYVQRRLSQRWNVNVGFVVTLALYTLIHVWSFNFMLLMAALVVGAFWGLLYRLRPQWLTALVISHAVWDACAFVFFPF